MGAFELACNSRIFTNAELWTCRSASRPKGRMWRSPALLFVFVCTSPKTAASPVRKTVYPGPRDRNFTCGSVWPTFASKLSGISPKFWRTSVCRLVAPEGCPSPRRGRAPIAISPSAANTAKAAFEMPGCRRFFPDRWNGVLMKVTFCFYVGAERRKQWLFGNPSHHPRRDWFAGAIRCGLLAGKGQPPNSRKPVSPSKEPESR